MSKIHPTAIISRKAKLADDVEISQFVSVADGAVIKEGVKIGPFAVIGNNTTIGKNCRIFTGAVVGSIPQDLKYGGEQSFLEIGDNNVIREYCTLNLGTGDGGRTIVGSGNLLMAYSHIAHDCRVGNDCVIANNGTLAGHVTIEDRAVIGGLSAVHQFVRVGELSIIGGCSKVVQDIPPFSTCDGHPARVYGLNLLGLRRAKFSSDTIKALSHAFKVIFASGLSPQHAAAEIDDKGIPELSRLVKFIKGSKRGISHSAHKYNA